MADKVEKATPWEYLEAYRDGTPYIFLYYTGEESDLPVYLAQKSAEGDPYAMCLYHWFLFRLYNLHQAKQRGYSKEPITAYGLDRCDVEEYDKKAFLYLRAAAEAGVEEAQVHYSERKKYYTYPLYQGVLPEFLPYNDYVNEKMYQKRHREKAGTPASLDTTAYIQKKLQALEAKKRAKAGTPAPVAQTAAQTVAQPTAQATATPPTESKVEKKSEVVERPTRKKTTTVKKAVEKPVQPVPAPTKHLKNEEQYFEEMFKTAIRYNKGDGVKQDYKKALELFEKVAAHGVVSAMVNCGLCYEFGRGVEKDYMTAMDYYRKASEKGNLQALMRLGLLLTFFCDQYEEGMACLKKSYENGYTLAASTIASACEIKRSPFYSIPDAILWFERAAEKEQSGDLYSRLGFLYEKHDKTMEGQKKALEWYIKAYDAGETRAALSIGLLSSSLAKTPKDYETAYEWYKKALPVSGYPAKAAMEMIDKSRCPKCKAAYSGKYKKTLFGERFVCSECGAKLQER